MKIHLSSATFYNRAPFEKLELYFGENEIAVLTAVNGRGKTTVLSHIVDAFHELARRFFPNEYEGKENKFYRVSSQSENLDSTRPSLVYLRFKTTSDEDIDYVNARGALTEAEYNALELPGNKIQFSSIKESIDRLGFAKHTSSNLDQKKAEAIFSSNILTYFPSYRYEAPGYLNDPYKVELDFAKSNIFSGRLRNPIEVISGLPQLANWIMDVVLDIRLNDVQSQVLFANLNTILTNTIISKGLGPLRFGIGARGMGGARIQVVKNQTNPESIYPSIFNISSGESSILCMFGELIRQADNNVNNIQLEAISGIVLIDEVDKHLHIKLQKEILPALFKLFPSVQFILSSHSPFLSMGLAEVTPTRAKIIDLETFGISKDPTTNELYSEVYRMMVGENDRFKELYRVLEEKVKNDGIPLVITEGKTDAQHLRNAKSRLNIQGCDVEFFDITGDWGDSKLEALLEQLSKVPQSRKIIGIFDRDVAKIVAEIETTGSTHKNYGNNVFAFCIPVPIGREQYTNISIEFFYHDSDLKKEKDGRRLYFDNEVEFRQSAAKKSERTLIRLDEAKSCDENTKKIFDENVGALNWIHSKAVFSALVENDADFAKDFDFSSFQSIFARLEEIIAPTAVIPSVIESIA
ncbi:MAG: AAA family ATPase [Gallionella sp.]|nr:AAA family ATPase [Gallionella sp.]